MPKVTAKQVRKWCFTYNNPSEHGHTGGDIDNILRRAGCTDFIFQDEVGESGTHHLQGVINLETKRRFSFVKNLINNQVHWEACIDWAGAWAYCSDPNKRQPGGQCWQHGRGPVTRVSRGDGSEPVLREYSALELGILEERQLWTWQRSLVARCQQRPHPRRVSWYWEPDGNMGKTALARYLMHHHGALYVTGKMADIACGFVNYAKCHGGEAPTIILIDVPRSHLSYLSYQAMEKLKDGMLFATKYESQQLLFPPPHLFIFANEQPDLSKLSKDRWEVIKINKDTLDDQVLVPDSPDPNELFDMTQGYAPIEDICDSE